MAPHDPKKAFRLEEHPELRRDFFALPEGFEDRFPFALQQRLAQEKARATRWSLRRAVWLLAPTVSVACLVVAAFVWLAPEQAAEPTLSYADLRLESIVEEAATDPELSEYLMEALPPDAAQAALQTALTAIPDAALNTFLTENADEGTLAEYLDSQP